jgi:proline iminopeptidase
LPDPDLVSHFDEDAVALAIARIEAHYFAHRLFLEPDELLRGIGRLRTLPCTIVQGRYDIVCPIRSADDLHRAWPEAQYVVVADAGHSAREPGIARELVAATDRFRARLKR